MSYLLSEKMTEKEIYEELKRKAGERIFSFILFTAMPKKKLARLMNKVGIVYEGIRTTSLEKNELAMVLSEETFKDPDVGIEVIKALNRENEEAIQLVSQQSASTIESLLRRHLIPEEKIGSTLWALLVDDRVTVNKLARHIINEFHEVEKNMRRTAGRLQLPFPPEEVEEEIEEMEPPEEIKAIFQDVEDSLKEAKNLFLKELSRKERTEHKYGKMKDELSTLRKSEDELKRKIKLLERDKDNLLTELEHFKKVSGKADHSKEETLSHRVNQLERENRKLSYELEKRREEGEKLRVAEQENSTLKKELEELKKENLLLEEKLKEAEKEIQKLKAKPAPEEVKPKIKPSPSFKEKGRRLGIFVDGQYIYSTIKAEGKKKFDYQKLLFIARGNRYLVKAICYIIKAPQADVQSFLTFLKANGYEVKVKEIEEPQSMDWSAGIAHDVLSMVDSLSLDIVVLVSGKKEMVEVVNSLREKKIRVEVIGWPAYVATELEEKAHEFIPVTEDMVV